jgi:hypothetical protein
MRSWLTEDDAHLRTFAVVAVTGAGIAFGIALMMVWDLTHAIVDLF